MILQIDQHYNKDPGSYRSKTRKNILPDKNNYKLDL